MNMFAVLFVYGLFMLAVGLYHSGKIGDYHEFVLAGSRQRGLVVTMSLLATLIGGSATLGIVDMSWNVGFPAFWWLGVGAVGLLLQGWLLSVKVREMGAYTLPDVANMTVGPEARTLCALIIAVTWTGIVAAQFTALSQIFSVLTGMEDSRTVLVAVSLVVILYTAAGGQLSVLHTDTFQLGMIFGGVAVTCAFLYLAENATPGLWLSRIELLNDRFRGADLASLALLVGATYFIGPDIFSRNLTAKDGRTARRSTLTAGVFLGVFGVMIVLVGMWTKAHGVGGNGVNPLVALIKDYLPFPVAMLLGLGLISALVSSADTCLMSAATILEHDLLKRRSLGRVRVFVILVGLISLAIGLMKSDIIGLLLAAYSVYSPGIVLPLFVAIMCYGKRPLYKPMWLTGVALGGVCGFAASFTGMPALPLIGMAISGLLAVGSLFVPGRKRGQQPWRAAGNASPPWQS